MESGFLLDVVVSQSSSICKFFTSYVKSLLIGWDTFLVLDLSLNVLNRVRWFDIEGNGLSSQGLNEDLHTTSESQDQMESGFLLDVVVSQSSSIFKLLTSEDKSLLIGWDTFLVLDLSLNVLNGVRWFDIEGDGLSSQGLNEDLHTTSESQDQMESGFLLDVVVSQSSSIFKLLTSKD